MTAPVNLTEMNAAMLRAYNAQLKEAAQDPSRLERVYGSRFIGSGQDSRLHAICRTAAQLTCSYASEVNLLTEDTQVTVASYRSQTTFTPLAQTYCQHQLLAANHPMNIADSQDSVLLCAVDATVDGMIRAYLGVPLIAAEGLVIGTLCVYDIRPHHWNVTDVTLLSSLAAQVMQLEAA